MQTDGKMSSANLVLYSSEMLDVIQLNTESAALKMYRKDMFRYWSAILWQRNYQLEQRRKSILLLIIR